MNHPGGARFAPPRELRDAAIEETADWPFEEASIIFKYILDRAYPNHKLDREILHAISCLNTTAVAIILRQPGLVHTRSSPERLYDAVRAALINAFPRGPDDSATQAEVCAWRKAHADISSKAWTIIFLIREHYSSHPLGGTVLTGFVDKIWTATFPELLIA
jgi:hypothetical protein